MYAEFWDRVQNNPEETMYSTVDEGMAKLLEGQNVIHVNYGNLVGFFQANPFSTQRIKVFAKGRAEYFSYILPFNSPLKPILQKGTNLLIESGTVSFLLKLWEGKGIPINPPLDAMVLTPGQVFLIFFIVLLTFGCAGVVLFCEVGWKELTSGKFRHSGGKHFFAKMSGEMGKMPGKLDKILEM